jgi:hypothetical protein
MVSLRYVTLCLISGAGLLLEIALTRLFSAVYYPPYVFGILALAVLGIGLGAATALSHPSLHDEGFQPLYMAGAAISAVIIPVVFALAIPLGGLVFVLAMLPFAFVGLSLVSIFSRGSTNRLYTADLLGAGLGAVLAVPIMNAIGPINALLVAALLFGIAGLYPRLRLNAVLPVLMGALLVSNLVFSWLRIDYATLTTAKPIQDSLRSGEIIATDWDAFARTDLVQPDDDGPYRLYMDGAAASVMPPSDNNDFLLRNIGFFPFATIQPERALIIGPGAGLDVWFALNSDVQATTAVEVNPASVDLVRNYAEYNGSLYQQPSVEVIVDEGRSVLRRDESKYDLIFLSQVVTLTSERVGYALTENTIYTVEAFQDYWSHLTDDGYVALTMYDEATLTRALSTAIAALRQQNLSDAEALGHMAAFLDTQSGRPIPLLMIGRQPFTRDDSLVFGAIAAEVGFNPLYLPEAFARPPLDAVEAGTMTFADIIAESATDISAPTDNRPFFYQFERGIPQDIQPLLIALGVAVAILTVLVALTQRRVSSVGVRWSPIYFAGLGVGFMLIEVGAIQQSRLFIGHPTLALTTVLAVMLIGGGIGSWLSEQLNIQSPRWPLVGVVLMVLLWLLIWPLVSSSLMAQPEIGRIFITVVCLLPVAIFMGMPFPLGLKLVRPLGNNQIALAWAVNGVATVCGSVGAVAIALLSGFSAVLIVGILAYVIAAIFAFGLLRHVTPAT